MAELLEKIPTERCWEITTKILSSLFVLRGEKIIAPAMGMEEGVVAPVLGAEKWTEINVKIFGNGSKILFPLFKDMFNIPVENAIDASDLVEVVSVLQLGPTQGEEFGENVEYSPERVIWRQHKCTWMERYKEFKADHAFIPCDKGACQAWGEEGLKAVNPKLTWKVTKAMPSGDPYCEFIYEFKEE